MGLWPVFGFLTPIYMFVLFMGYTMILIFLPNGAAGTIIFWVLVFAIAGTSHLIPHDPIES